VITAEAGFSPHPPIELRVEPLVETGAPVAQGMPILRDRRRQHCVITAPMSGRIAGLEIGVGRRLHGLVVEGDGGNARHAYEVREAALEVKDGSGSAALRELLQSSGLWMRLRARPFGRIPDPAVEPAAIIVMAVDTRPLAPSPRLALGDGAADLLTLGTAALARLSAGPIFVCQDRGPELLPGTERVRIVRSGTLHPAGLAGLQLERLFPARLDREVWDVALEDVLGIGQLLALGRLPQTQLVAVAGPGMRSTRLLRCQPGADLRELCHGYMTPGPRIVLSGSVLGGREARWLGFRDRQVTVLRRAEPAASRHWLEAALRRASRAEPVIATAALEQALGGPLPGIALLRALSVGDDEAAVELGALSLLEEDLELVDYVTAAAPPFAGLLRAALERIEADA
jgi:Na+-transporting NADH:ubiquinone oxidoreductase subunit A